MYLFKVRSFSSVKVSSIIDHVKPTIRDDKSDHVILHAGTIDLQNEKTSTQISKSIIELAMPLIKDGHLVDNLNNKANEDNNCLVVMC